MGASPFRRGADRELLRLGLPNHALTLTERAPALLVPVLTAQVASPTVTAAWYPAWMMAWVAYTAPVAVGLAQFSDIVRRPDRIRETTVTRVAMVAVVGRLDRRRPDRRCPAAAVDPRTLSTPSRPPGRCVCSRSVLVPYAIVQAYNSVCRARQRLTEATATGLVLGAAACTATVAVADRGTTMMAAAWVTVFTLGAVWCGVRLLNMIAERPPLVILAAAD